MADLVFKQTRGVCFYFSDIGSVWRLVVSNQCDIYLIKMDESKDVNLDTMSFERFSVWTANSLRKYLPIHGKSTEGGINDLAAR